MMRFLLVLAWVGGLVPAHAGPPLGCLQNAAGGRWCEGERIGVTAVPVRLPDGWVHPATVRRAPRPFEGSEAIVQALPVEQLVRRQTIVGDGAPFVGRVSRDAAVGVSEVRTSR